jgi:predicted PolB exonuclease-like 3'-5' exonuclease
LGNVQKAAIKSQDSEAYGRTSFRQERAATLCPTSAGSLPPMIVGKSDVEIREAIGGKFPKHIYHSIVCIGALIAHREADHWAVDAVGAPHVGERTEKELITAFCDKIAELSPQLVTFNGNSFDLPVLRYRAMVHGVSAPGLATRPYFHRYTEDAIDLCDVSGPRYVA